MGQRLFVILLLIRAVLLMKAHTYGQHVTVSLVLLVAQLCHAAAGPAWLLHGTILQVPQDSITQMSLKWSLSDYGQTTNGFACCMCQMPAMLAARCAETQHPTIADAARQAADLSMLPTQGVPTQNSAPPAVTPRTLTFLNKEDALLCAAASTSGGHSKITKTSDK